MSGTGFDREFYGSAVHRGRWGRATLKGSIIRSRRRYLHTHAPEVIEPIRAEIGHEARAFLDGPVLVSARLPYSPLVELDAAIVRHAMSGEVQRMLPFAHEIATHDLDGGMYRGMLRVIGGSLSVRVYAMLYQTYWEPGRITASSERDATVITLEDAVLPRYMCRYGFTGYVERLLEIAGAPAGVEHRCMHEGEPACRWVVRHR